MTPPPVPINVVERYVKLRAVENPAANAPAAEQQSASEQLKKLRDKYPGVEAAADVYEYMQRTKDAPKSESATAQTLRAFLDEAFQSVKPTMQGIGRTVLREAAQGIAAEVVDEIRRTGDIVRERARAGTRDVLRRINPMRGGDHVPKKKPATRKSVAELIATMEIAAITLGDERDDEAGEDAIVCVSVIMPADAASALIDNDSGRIHEKIGAAVAAALDVALNEGEYGEWPFGDPEEEEEDEDSEG